MKVRFLVRGELFVVTQQLLVGGLDKGVDASQFLLDDGVDLLLNTDLTTPYADIRDIILGFFKSGKVLMQIRQQPSVRGFPQDRRRWTSIRSIR